MYILHVQNIKLEFVVHQTIYFTLSDFNTKLMNGISD